MTKGAPSRRRPPKAITRSSPAEGAGTRSGSTVASAESMQPVIRLIVAERAFTGAGERGLTRLPSGKVRLIGRKQPPLFGIDGSVTALTAKQAAARLPDGTQFTGPRACGLVPVRSKWMSPPSTVTATSTRSRRSSSMPSLSSQSTCAVGARPGSRAAPHASSSRRARSGARRRSSGCCGRISPPSAAGGWQAIRQAAT